ncbi:GNAT family N-acetyltransferase [Mycobacterium spongiae]|uniref:GNAT family N-acetyltransferase n=1 Tax=Mycobacterium spongiae TaxID=886343 RepID=UPI001FE54C02|nr:GNAT family N-acetyltransferase [Mycobacterium spongiae]
MARELASVAARTFPLACPPSVPADHVASFVDANLSATRFAEYLADARRAILAAQHDRRIVGYAMLVRGGSERDLPADVARAVGTRPTAELSKMYLLPDFHGTDMSTALMNAALAAAGDWGVHCVWLGVNQKNSRAQRFYAKSGFRINGTRTFQLGTHTENDYVMVREL